MRGGHKKKKEDAPAREGQLQVGEAILFLRRDEAHHTPFRARGAEILARGPLTEVFDEKNVR